MRSSIHALTCVSKVHSATAYSEELCSSISLASVSGY